MNALEQRVCIGVCTCQRPKMLERCLASLIAQVRIDPDRTHIVVVDNDAGPSAKGIVESAAAKSAFPVHYHHEPRRGIPMARNRVLSEALALKADWLIFVDDDQAAASDCVYELFAAANRSDADVVKASVIHIYPEPAPFWCIHTNSPMPGKSDPAEARIHRYVSTNGVLVSARLFRLDGLGLQFNEALACEEDGDFFSRAIARGAVIVRASAPILMEESHPSRYSYLRVALNGLSRGGAHVAQCRANKGYWRALQRYPFAALARTAKGVGQFLIAPVFIPFSMKRFKFTVLDAGKNIFMAAGMLGGLFSLQYQYYKKVDGC